MNKIENNSNAELKYTAQTKDLSLISEINSSSVSSFENATKTAPINKKIPIISFIKLLFVMVIHLSLGGAIGKSLVFKTGTLKSKKDGLNSVNK